MNCKNSGLGNSKLLEIDAVELTFADNVDVVNSYSKSILLADSCSLNSTFQPNVNSDNTLQCSILKSYDTTDQLYNHPEDNKQAYSNRFFEVQLQKERKFYFTQKTKDQYNSNLSTNVITYDEAIKNLHEKQVLDIYSHMVIEEDPRKISVLRSWINYIFGHTKLSENLKDKKTYILCLSKISFDNSSNIHFQILQTIFKCLVNDSHCPRFGEHWEMIGFQGSDPASDMRSGGLLSLLQILHFITQSRILVDNIFQLSKDVIQEFPFCAVGINLTVICLKVLKSGVLNKEFNNSNIVMEVLNQLYCSIFYEFYSQWKLKQKTIIHCNSTLQYIEKKALKHPCKLMKAYKKQFPVKSDQE